MNPPSDVYQTINQKIVMLCGSIRLHEEAKRQERESHQQIAALREEIDKLIKANLSTKTALGKGEP